MADARQEGVRPASESSIEISFWLDGRLCVERLRMKPSPRNLERAARLRDAVLTSIEQGNFDPAKFFPRH